VLFFSQSFTLILRIDAWLGLLPCARCGVTAPRSHVPTERADWAAGSGVIPARAIVTSSTRRAPVAPRFHILTTFTPIRAEAGAGQGYSETSAWGSHLAVPRTPGGGLLCGLKLKKHDQELTLGSKVGLL
jgi:hypothetical protein